MPEIKIKYDPNKIASVHITGIVEEILKAATASIPGVDDCSEIAVFPRQHEEGDRNVLPLEITIMATETEERISTKGEVFEEISEHMFQSEAIPEHVIQELGDEKISLWYTLVKGQFGYIW